MIDHEMCVDDHVVCMDAEESVDAFETEVKQYVAAHGAQDYTLKYDTQGILGKITVQLGKARAAALARGDGVLRCVHGRWWWGRGVCFEAVAHHHQASCYFTPL